eukprot:6401172-Prorocentrum_lima.AAC.1
MMTLMNPFRDLQSTRSQVDEGTHSHDEATAEGNEVAVPVHKGDHSSTRPTISLQGRAVFA